MADFDWKQDSQAGDINLLPDDLRRKEADELASTPAKEIELRQPKKVDTAVPEGRVPWFSFRSWFGRDKTPKQPTAEHPAEDKVKSSFSFRLIPSKKRQEQEELERIKENNIRQHIIREVFQKKGLPLPDNDNSIFNEERRAKQKELESHIGDMDIEGSKKTAESVPVAPVAPAMSQPLSAPIPPVSMELPDVKPEQPLIVPTLESVVVPEEPITPPLPPRPEMPRPLTTEQPKPAIETLETIANDLPPVNTSANTPADPIAPSPTKGFHMPTGVFQKPVEKKDHPKSPFGVNLIPTSITVRSWSQLRNLFLALVVGTIVLLIVAYGGLLWWDQEIERQTSEVDAKIHVAEGEVLKFQGLKDQIAATESQIKDIETLLGKHVYWTQFFTLLEKYTVTDVYFDRFTAGVNGNLTLNAHGKDFSTAARQLKLLQSPEAKEFITAVGINGVTDSEQGTTFTLDLTLNSKLFYYAHASSTQQ